MRLTKNTWWPRKSEKNAIILFVSFEPFFYPLEKSHTFFKVANIATKNDMTQENQIINQVTGWILVNHVNRKN